MNTLLREAARLAVLLFCLITLLFFLLRSTGDPAVMLAGSMATPEQVERVRVEYGLDGPLWQQYLSYMGRLLHLDFQKSLSSGEPAIKEVLSVFPATLLLSGLALALTVIVSVPLGVWIGYRPTSGGRRLVSAVVFLGQGVPGFVVALLLIQVVSVGYRLLPPLGMSFSDPRTWILPTISLSAFLIPKLVRVVAANVDAALREPYIDIVRANGVQEWRVIWLHAVPNALLGAVALVSTFVAILISGSVIIETIFAWPGVGWLLIESVHALDFPVIQALTFLIAVSVFLANLTADLSYRLLDPRLRDA